MPKSYLQVSEYYPTCINGSLTVYIAGTTELATVFNPISGAEITNPIPIGSDGYVQAYNVLNGAYYDVVAKDAIGAVRFERQNIFPIVSQNNALDQINHSETSFSGSLDSNVIHKFGTMSSLSFTLNPINPDNANIYTIQFASGSTPTTVTFPAGISWRDGEAPTITANTLYEISILNNFAMYGAT